MDREKQIEFCMEWSGQQAKMAEKIAASYREYLEGQNEIVFQRLLSYLDVYCGWYVRKTLYKTGCYTEDNIHTILQESRIAVWKKVSEDIETNTVRDYFVRYAFGIYKNQTVTIVKKICKQRHEWGEDRSLSEPIDDSERTLGDTIKYENNNYDEKRKVYDRLFQIYCKTFMNSKMFPPSSLALYYARVLPHLLHINHDIKTIPEKKVTSAKWAYEKMYNKTIFQLKEDSQTVLRNEVNSDLVWCESFIRQLEETLTIGQKSYFLKDIIYTEVYDKRKIEDWADYMHRATIKVAKEEIVRDSDFLEMAKEYIFEQSRLNQLMKGGKRK